MKRNIYSFNGLIIHGLLALIFLFTYAGSKAQTTNVVMLKTLIGHTEPINCIAFSPDGKLIASGSDEESLMSESGKFEIIIWNIADGKILTSLRGHKNPILSLAFNNNGTRLVSSDSKGDIKIWDIKNYSEIRTISGKDWISSVCFTPDNKFILGEFTFKNRVGLWDANTGSLITFFDIKNQIGSMDISPDGSKIALSCYHQIQIWSLKSRQQLLSIDDNSVNGFAIRYSPNGKLLASGQGDGEIKIYDPNTLSIIFTLNGHFKPVLSISINYDDKFMVSGSSDQMIKIWNLQTRTEVKSLVNEHKGTIKAVAFSPNSNLFATAGEDKTVKIWQIK